MNDSFAGKHKVGTYVAKGTIGVQESNVPPDSLKFISEQARDAEKKSLRDILDKISRSTETAKAILQSLLQELKITDPMKKG